jgi:hypothetical protein
MHRLRTHGPADPHPARRQRSLPLMATIDTDVPTTLDWERRHRTPAAVAAGVAGVATLAGNLYAQLSAYNDVPTIGAVQALTPALQGRAEPAINPRTAIAQFLADNSTSLIFAGVLTSLGAAAAGYALYYLFRATQARRRELPPLARWVVVIGATLVALSYLLQPIFRSIRAQSFLDGADRTRDAIDSALSGGPLVVVSAIGLAGQLALALAFVLVCLNAMRAGLLTRFMGVLGIIVGVLYVFPFGQLPVVQSFWLVALVPLFVGRWPQGTPPAWTSGVAEPWPSAAALREQRMRAARGGGGRDDDAGAAAALDAPEPAPVPQRSGSRKRRKRR